MVKINIRGTELTSVPFSDIDVLPLMSLANALSEGGKGLADALKESYLVLRAIFGSDIDEFWNLTDPDHPRTFLHAREVVGIAMALGEALQADPNYVDETAPEVTPKGFGDLVSQSLTAEQAAKEKRIEQLTAEINALKAHA
jgi:hypothetical protein